MPFTLSAQGASSSFADGRRNTNPPAREPAHDDDQVVASKTPNPLLPIAQTVARVALVTQLDEPALRDPRIVALPLSSLMLLR